MNQCKKPGKKHNLVCLLLYQLSSAGWLLHFSPEAPLPHMLAKKPKSGLAAVTVVNLCFIKVNNMSVQYTVSQYINALVNVDVKTIFKIQNLSTTNVFIIILSQKEKNQARYAW